MCKGSPDQSCKMSRILQIKSWQAGGVKRMRERTVLLNQVHSFGVYSGTLCKIQSTNGDGAEPVPEIFVRTGILAFLATLVALHFTPVSE